MSDCRHGAEMCDQCLDILADGIKQGREEERASILEYLNDQNNGYDWHSGCRLCEVIFNLENELDKGKPTPPGLHTFAPGGWVK